MKANNGSKAAQLIPTITPERFWHERAVEHQQRLIIIRLLASIDRKLELLVQQRGAP
jgi:hypothetical protein